MAGVVTGVDSKGRRYKTVNGRRVAATDHPASGFKKQKSGSGSIPPTALRDPLRRIFKKYLGRGGDHGAIRNAIAQVINQHLHALFSIQAKTAVGKFGKAYAARNILNTLRHGGFNDEDRNEEDTKLIKSMSHNGDLDGHAFMSHLKSMGVPIKGEFLNQETPPEPENDDQAILGVVHKYHLNADQLDRILSKTLKS